MHRKMHLKMHTEGSALVWGLVGGAASCLGQIGARGAKHQENTLSRGGVGGRERRKGERGGTNLISVEISHRLLNIPV